MKLDRRTYWAVIVEAVATAVTLALIAPAFGNDPVDMAFRGFTVGVVFAPILVAFKSWLADQLSGHRGNKRACAECRHPLAGHHPDAPCFCGCMGWTPADQARTPTAT